jgi:hypothetical protein
VPRYAPDLSLHSASCLSSATLKVAAANFAAAAAKLTNSAYHDDRQRQVPLS